MSNDVITTRVETAHHEAGHAIAYMAHGLTFRYITLRPVRSSGALGMIRQWRPKLRDGQTMSVVLLAGLTAECLYRGLSDPELECGWIERDDVLAGVYLTLMEHRHFDEIAEADRVFPIQSLSAKIEKTTLLIDRAWSSVSALAQACLDSPRAITYPEALRAIGAENPEHAMEIIYAPSPVQVGA